MVWEERLFRFGYGLTFSSLLLVSDLLNQLCPIYSLYCSFSGRFNILSIKQHLASFSILKDITFVFLSFLLFRAIGEYNSSLALFPPPTLLYESWAMEVSRVETQMCANPILESTRITSFCSISESAVSNKQEKHSHPPKKAIHAWELTFNDHRDVIDCGNSTYSNSATAGMKKEIFVDLVYRIWRKISRFAKVVSTKVAGFISVMRKHI